MNFSEYTIWFFTVIILLGFAGGFLAGMLGVGGGLVFVPVFQEIVKNHEVAADRVPYVLANSLLIVFIVGISGSIKHIKIKNTNLPAAYTTGLAAVFSSLLLSYILRYFNINDQKMFNYIFCGILLITGIRMWYGKAPKGSIENEKANIPPLKNFIPAGLIAGLITAITGLGGGVILIPYFNKVLKLPIKFSTGLSLTVIPIIALPLLMFYMLNKPEMELFKGLQTGHILWPTVIPMIISAAIASPFGIKTAQKMNSNTLLIIFLIFIAVNMTKILFF
jgi:uncharacterized membrane protein YfcA